MRRRKQKVKRYSANLRRRVATLKNRGGKDINDIMNECIEQLKKKQTTFPKKDVLSMKKSNKNLISEIITDIRSSVTPSFDNVMSEMCSQQPTKKIKLIDDDANKFISKIKEIIFPERKLNNGRATTTTNEGIDVMIQRLESHKSGFHISEGAECRNRLLSELISKLTDIQTKKIKNPQQDSKFDIDKEIEVAYNNIKISDKQFSYLFNAEKINDIVAPLNEALSETCYSDMYVKKLQQDIDSYQKKEAEMRTDCLQQTTGFINKLNKLTQLPSPPSSSSFSKMKSLFTKKKDGNDGLSSFSQQQQQQQQQQQINNIEKFKKKIKDAFEQKLQDQIIKLQQEIHNMDQVFGGGK